LVSFYRVIDESSMTLATDLTTQWVGGWFWQEKIRDCRVMWDGFQFWTRGGNAVNAPDWFTKGLPKVRIDGGIWAGRNGFQIASNAVRLGGHHWDESDLLFAPFDLPDMAGRWDIRQREAAKAIKGCACAAALPFGRVNDSRWTGDKNDFAQIMLKFSKLGSEGAMFRSPESETYETGRSQNLQRFKLTAN
jgi:DNA ligase-1